MNRGDLVGYITLCEERGLIAGWGRLERRPQKEEIGDCLQPFLACKEVMFLTVMICTTMTLTFVVQSETPKQLLDSLLLVQTNSISLLIL